MSEYEEICLSMQKTPVDGFVRLFAFDVNPDTMEMKLAHMQEMDQEKYELSVQLLEDFMIELKKSKQDANCTKGEQDGE